MVTKLDFTKVKVYDGISRKSYSEMNLSEAVADILYKNSAGIAGLELARKIYNAKAEEEYEDREIEIIRSILPQCTARFNDAILEMIGTQE